MTDILGMRIGACGLGGKKLILIAGLLGGRWRIGGEYVTLVTIGIGLTMEGDLKFELEIWVRLT